MVKLFLLTSFAAVLSAQTAPLTPLEKAFQDSMAGVALEGQSTRDGSPTLSEDKYDIEKIVKTGDDQWTIFARVAAKGQTMTVPLPIQVKWAGDTPVITLTDQAMPGMGTYTRAWWYIAASTPAPGAAGTAAARFSAASSRSSSYRCSWRDSSLRSRFLSFFL